MWIGVGICHENIMERLGYVFNNWQLLGMGLYMITSDGYVFCHNNDKINNTRKVTSLIFSLFYSKMVM
jgi:hypothetical protein